MMESGEMVQIPQLVVGLTRDNHAVAKQNGAMYLKPELETARGQTADNAHRLEVLTSWVDASGKAVPECPRNKIRDLCEQLRQREVRILAGFEIEVVFGPADRGSLDEHGWCSMTAQDATIIDAIEAIVQALGDAGVDVQQFHAEACPGQWEFVLGPQPPLQAVDGLVVARETIAVTARRHGLSSTLHPRPYPGHTGTGSHVHLSANGPLASDGEVEKTTAASFFGGILAHLPAIAAFSLPLDVSYERVKAGIFSSGEWVCWGTQNRETPLRRISKGRFEVRSVCGTANPYLVMAAMLGAGLDGLERSLELPDECAEDPSELSEFQREMLGVRTHLPQSVEESMEALAKDVALSDKLGPRILTPYAAVTTAWNAHLRSMEPLERHNLLLHSY